MRFPFADQLPGTSSPPGFDVIWVSPPPSDERIVWMPFWLPSSLNVSQRSSVPSSDGIPHGLKSVGYWPSTMREVPSSGLMIHEPPPGSGQQVAMWAPSENHRGNSPVSVGPCMGRSPVPPGLPTYACVSLSAGLNRANVSWPFVPGGLAPAGSAATATNATARSATRRTRPPCKNLMLASLSPPKDATKERAYHRSHWPLAASLIRLRRKVNQGNARLLSQNHQITHERGPSRSVVSLTPVAPERASSSPRLPAARHRGFVPPLPLNPGQRRRQQSGSSADRRGAPVKRRPSVDRSLARPATA